MAICTRNPNRAGGAFYLEGGYPNNGDRLTYMKILSGLETLRQYPMHKAYIHLEYKVFR